MTIKKKTLISSILAIVLCASLMVGSTFALFTSESKVNIAVTSGRVKITATIDADSLKLYSATAEETDDVAGEIVGGSFAGTYYYEEVSPDFTNGGEANIDESKSTLTLDRITPGDKVRLNVDITNASNVNIKYRTRIDVVGDDSLFGELDITIYNEDSPEEGVAQTKMATISEWKDWTPTEESVRKVGIEIVFPITADNIYQDKTIELSFAIEAVQGNAAWALLDRLNTKLANEAVANDTMSDALSDVISIADEATIKSSGFIWDSEQDRFTTESAVVADEVRYFKIYDSMPIEQTYSIYASSQWNAPVIDDLTVGFDAGSNVGITSIVYDRSSATVGQSVIIKTNGGSLTVNAPLDTFVHYGSAANVNIIATANSSYHEFGAVSFVEITKGRIALESGSNVSQVHISKVENTELFDEIILAVAPSITISAENTVSQQTAGETVITRDDVAIDETTGTLVLALQMGTEEVTEETDLDYIWLTKQGIFEQIKVSTESDISNAVWADDDVNSQETQVTAKAIANNIARDSSNNIDVKVEVTNESETKTYKVDLNENRELVVVDIEDETQTAVATVSASGIVTVNETEYSVELSTNNSNTTELVITNTTDETDVVKAKAVEETGLTEADKEEVKDNALIDDIETNDYYVVRIGTKGYVDLQSAIADLTSNQNVYVLADSQASPLTITGVSNVGIYLNGHTLTGDSNYVLRLYDCSDITIENGTLFGQIRVGEHKWTIAKWKDYDDVPLYGYHPLAPAQNVAFNDVSITADGDKPIFYFTNIEDDLTRANESNLTDNDLYGHYIYKNGYTKETYQSGKWTDGVVFTFFEGTDTVTVNGGVFTGKMVGNMVDFDGDLYTDVLRVESGEFSNDGLGRFVSTGKYLVGDSSDNFVVAETAPEEYTAKINNVYYTYVGGANDAITFANFGETVYIKENADVVKYFGEDADGNADELTIVYLAENIAYTGGVALNATYEMMMKDSEIVEGGIVFYSAFDPVVAVYATGQGGNWKTSSKVGEYASLVDAFGAVQSNYTVVILKDFTVGDESSYAYGGSQYKCAVGYATRSTIDFNGHTITYTGTGACIVSSQSSGYLYLKDTSAEKTGGITATQGYCFQKVHGNTDNVYVQGGTYIAEKNGKSAISISYNKIGSSFNISGGTFIASGTTQTIGYLGGNASKVITISGGTFSRDPSTITKVSITKSVVLNDDGTYSVK